MSTRILTKRAMKFRAFLLPIEDLELWRSAAAREGLSQSEFVRRALKEKAGKVLEADESDRQNRA